MKLIRKIAAAVLLSCLFAAPTSRANVLVTGTRVVFPAQPGEVTVRLTNENTRPALVEAWIDRGDPTSTPDKADTPFLITPPLFRMEPHQDQSLRILYTHEPLPVDRESLFWLNVLEVPPKPDKTASTSGNYLQFAIRSRLKLFFRPAGLGDPAKSPAQLVFKVVAEGNGYALAVHNPTPFYITLAKAGLGTNGQAGTVDAGMVAPYSNLHLPLHGISQVPAVGAAVNFEVVNDYGALAPFAATLGS